MSELVVKFKDGRQLIFDASTLEDASKCLWYYKARNLDRWTSRVRPISAQWGTMLHSCLETYDQNLKFGHADAVDASIDQALKFGPELRESFDNTRTSRTLVRAVSYYTDLYREDPYVTARHPDGTACIEVRFEFPIPNRPYRISGLIDRLAYERNNLFIVDRKTTSKTLNAQWWKQFLPGIQIPTYLLATYWLGFKPKGAMIEGCQTMVNGCRWQRQTFEPTYDHLMEWQVDMVALIDEIDHAHQTGHWPRRRTSCELHGGCTMRDVCNTAPGQRHRPLNERFHQVPYIPRA